VGVIISQIVRKDITLLAAVVAHVDSKLINGRLLLVEFSQLSFLSCPVDVKVQHAHR
jgi:hypothetical protein